jgi:hypothetical protein
MAFWRCDTADACRNTRERFSTCMKGKGGAIHRRQGTQRQPSGNRARWRPARWRGCGAWRQPMLVSRVRSSSSTTRIHGVGCHCGCATTLLSGSRSTQFLSGHGASGLHRLAFHPTFYGPEHRFVQWQKSKARTIKRIANGFKTFLRRGQDCRHDV